MNGYLAAINSAEENAFFTDTIAPLAALGPRFEIWVGGHQPAGSPEPGGGWSWLSGEPWTYSNWSAGQPNNSWGGTEYVLTFYVAPNEFGNIGEWGDAPDNITSWFVVEYAVPEPSPAILLVLAGSLAALRQRFVFNRCWK